MSLVRTFCMLSAAAASSALASSAQAALITNGDFETGDLTGWTPSRNFSQKAVQRTGVFSGDFAARFGPSGKLGWIAQTIATEPGRTYTLSFALLNEQGRHSQFKVRIDGNLVTNLMDASQFGWTPFSMDFVAEDSQTRIDFGFQHAPGSWSLDSVAVTHVPEPTALALVGATAVLLMTRRRAS